MIFEITNQVRVTDFKEGYKWYEILFVALDGEELSTLNFINRKKNLK